VRHGAKAEVESCSFFKNGGQGIMVWNGAGRFEARNTEVHSNIDSGVLVEENETSAIFESCELFGNGMAGLASQRKGRVKIGRCKVHSNIEGILLQDTGSGTVVDCDVFENRANGIFVGYDHLGAAEISANRAYKNRMKGILLGTGRSKNVSACDNEEWENYGLPPDTPSSDFFNCQSTEQRDLHLRRWAKNMEKSGGSIKNAAAASGEETLFDRFCSLEDDFGGLLAKSVLACSFCRTQPGKKKFKTCDVCRSVSYCSRECQKAHWSEHKKSCKPRPPEHPSFVDKTQSVDEHPGAQCKAM